GQMTIAFPSIHRFVTEEFFSSCLALARGLVGDKLRPQRLEFSYPEPEYRDQYEAVFECPLAFDQPQDRLVLDADWLAAPLPTHNP
ncbi:AraC family transcriptional regulator, partial [Salinisphaera sp. USBA-960]|nr:AraC family transcriptional regulator [Salifodinibacter halophilus]